MKIMLKRILICIMSMLLCIAMLPLAAFAAEAEPVDPADDPGIVIELPEETYSVDGPADNDELFAKYVESRLAASVGDELSEPPMLRQARLTGVSAVIYEKLKDEIALVANGTNSSTKFTIPVEDLGFERLFWTPEELGVDWIYDGYNTINQDAIDALFDNIFGFDLGKITDLLLQECPYELYWYDKTVGINMTTPGISVRYFIDDYALTVFGNFSFSFSVADAYSGGNYIVNTDNALRVEHAVDKAKTIAGGASAMMDHDKLAYYKESICDLVEYDYSALGSDVSYGDPWQIINVFDEDNDTNVVCEGYSKAFKYLCDLTEFNNDIKCFTVTGLMTGGTGAGNHMWNIVTMEDGLNYLVDVTNCDGNSVGAPDRLFLKGAAEGSVENGYTFSTYYSNIRYIYDTDTKDIFDSELELSMKDYGFEEIEYKEDGLTYLISGKEAILSGYEGQPSKVIIPGEVNGCKVVRIGDEAFYNCTSLTKVYIPLSIRLIGQKAFTGTSITDFFYEGDYMQWLSLTYGNNVIPADANYTCEATAEDGHVFTTDFIIESYPTCTEAGISSRKCVMCGEKVVVEDPALGHDWSEWSIGKEATCTEAGIESRSCLRCGKKETVTIEAFGHTEVTLEAKDPTCTENGITEGKKCSVCGEVLVPQETVTALGHEWSEWTVDKEATPTEEGSEKRICSRCGEEETKVIPRIKITGWGEDEYGYKLYFDENGDMVTGWKLIDGDWYYFEPVTGRMKNGGVTIVGEDLYYLAEDGKMLSGWIEFEYEKEGPDGEMITASDWFYADPNNGSRLATGWKKIGGYWYYFEPKNKLGYGGYMHFDEWEKDSKGWCYLGHDGKMVTNDWAKDSKGWCWIGSNGYMVEKTQWIKHDGSWYYIEKGYRAQNAWKKDSKGWCYLGSDGRMVTNGWAKDSKGYCWIGSNGYMVEKTQWIKSGNDWYYINKGYRVQNAWKKDSKGWCYLGSDGRMVTNGWAKDSKGNCWIGPDGYMIEKTMLVTYEDETYGIDKGYMVVNRTITIEGKEYTFGPDGKLVP